MSGQPRLVYAGFWSRAWASVIDSVLVMVLVYPLLVWAYGSAYFRERLRIFDVLGQAWRGEAGIEALQSLQQSQGGALDFVVTYILPAVAVVLFWMYRSATPGKMAIRARIVDAATGGVPSNRQLLARYLGYFVSLFPFGLGFLWIALDDRKQGWHDKISGTVVVRRKR